MATTLLTPEEDEEHKLEMIRNARVLYSELSALSNPRDRVQYLEEWENVGGLLAYVVPERSPMAKYLTQERREAVADQINRAILYYAGDPPISPLEHYVRQNTVVWSMMRDMGFALPPAGARPPGIEPPPTFGMKVGAAAATAAGGKDTGLEAVPLFDLHEYLKQPKS